MNVTDYLKPASLTEAWRMKRACPEALYIAGGTDLMGQIRSGITRSPVLISLRNIDQLKGIELGLKTRIGSMTTISEIISHPKLCNEYPVLLDAARPFASMQIRNQATIGGNLCNASPCADMATVLLVLDARVCMEGPGGKREMMLDDFFLGEGKTSLASGEVLTSIVLEKQPPGTFAAYLKKRRVLMDLALVSVAVLLEIQEDRCTRARVAAGAVGPRHLRLRTAEAALTDRGLGADSLSRARKLAAREVSPITDVRSSAEYRRHMTGVLFSRAVDTLLARRNNDR